MKTTIVLLLVLVIIAGCQPGQPESEDSGQEPVEITGTFSITGAYAIYPLLQIWTTEFMAMHPGVSIELYRAGTGKGIEGLQSGASDVAMISREITPEEEALGFSIYTVAKDAVVPIVNAGNPFLDKILNEGLSHRQLQILFTMEKKPNWGEVYMIAGDEPVNVYTRSDASGAAIIWAGFLLADLKELKGINVEGDDSMVESILQDTNGIGYCNMIYIWDSSSTVVHPGLRVLPIDLNYNGRIDYKEVLPDNISEMRRHIQMGKYPHSLCRYLYLLINPGKTSDALNGFLEYTMTDGQALVENAGYCRVPKFVLDCQVNKLRRGK